MRKIVALCLGIGCTDTWEDHQRQYQYEYHKWDRTKKGVEHGDPRDQKKYEDRLYHGQQQPWWE
jgi:hypothetical protein